MSQQKRQQGAAAAVAQKPRAVSATHCDTMYPASFGVTQRGSASKGKGIAAACAVEKERETATKHSVATRRSAPPQRVFKEKEGVLRNKHGAVGGCCVHAVRICLFCFGFSLGRLRRLAHRAPLRQRQPAHGQPGGDGRGQSFRVQHGRGRSLALRRRGKAFSHGTDAGGGPHLDGQEAPGEGKAFA